jgi:hypothetical protein
MLLSISPVGPIIVPKTINCSDYAVPQWLGISLIVLLALCILALLILVIKMIFD